MNAAWIKYHRNTGLKFKQKNSKYKASITMKVAALIFASCLSVAGLAAAEIGFKVAPFVQTTSTGAVPWAITADKEVYSFIAPEGWTVAANPQLRRVSIRRGGSEISIVFLESSVSPISKIDQWVEELKKRIPNAQFGEAPSVRICGEKALVSDVNWMTKAAVGYAGRFARGTVGKTQLEFFLVAEEINFDLDRAAFNRVIGSFSTGVARTTARAARMGKE